MDKNVEFLSILIPKLAGSLLGWTNKARSLLVEQLDDYRVANKLDKSVPLEVHNYEPHVRRNDWHSHLQMVLHTMHRAGICHTDVKPDNILLYLPKEVYKHEAYLADFGLMDMLGDTCSNQRYTPGYQHYRTLDLPISGIFWSSIQPDEDMVALGESMFQDHNDYQRHIQHVKTFEPYQRFHL
jgi:serine/threonine protein kinase